MDAIILNQIRFSGDALDEEEDFEMEFQSFIVQVLSLMSTIMSIYPKLIFKDLKPLTAPLLLTMFLYSLKSPFESQKTYSDDQNLFLTDFLMETSVDYDSAVSIRSTVVDFLDEAFQHTDFSK